MMRSAVLTQSTRDRPMDKMDRQMELAWHIRAIEYTLSHVKSAEVVVFRSRYCIMTPTHLNAVIDQPTLMSYRTDIQLNITYRQKTSVPVQCLLDSCQDAQVLITNTRNSKQTLKQLAKGNLQQATSLNLVKKDIS